jgi:hypothetical protein
MQTSQGEHQSSAANNHKCARDVEPHTLNGTQTSLSMGMGNRDNICAPMLLVTLSVDEANP